MVCQLNCLLRAKTLNATSTLNLGKKMTDTSTAKCHKNEVSSGDRFKFGENWHNYLKEIDDKKIEAAKSSLKKMLKVEDLNGLRFLDIGSGSGLFSLAARCLGAEVTSFDYDTQSVECTLALKQKFFPLDDNWTVDQGSVLDLHYIKKLGKFDVVYSWGVLHHTGQMWMAIDNAVSTVSEKGKLFLAIYNDEGFISRYWWVIKHIYNRYPRLQTPLKIIYAPYFVGLGTIVMWIKYANRKRTKRGMNLWYDMVDWLGGYPFEVSTPKKMNAVIEQNGFKLINHYYVGFGLGCNEFVYQRY